MSAFGKRGVRCDGCGRFSQARRGAYLDRATGREYEILSARDYWEMPDAPEDSDLCNACGEGKLEAMGRGLQ